MAKTGNEIFNDKVNLIYEFDKSSPLFIRRAFILLSNNDVEEAINVLANGLKLFPYYSPARILYVKALIANNNLVKADSEIKILENDYLPEKTILSLKREIEIRQKPGYKPQFTDSIKPLSDLNEETDLLPSFNNSRSFEDNLDKIAKNLSNAKMPPPPSEKNDYDNQPLELPDENLIVSETMAKIYITQGEIKEAIKVYEKLLKKEPQKKDYYFQKIRELKNKPNL